jgi:thioredoxin 1
MGKFNEVINSGKTVLVDFSPEWCGPCKMMAPILKELASITNEDVKILKVDVDANKEAAMTFQVQSVPTLILFKNGQVKWRPGLDCDCKGLPSWVKRGTLPNTRVTNK